MLVFCSRWNIIYDVARNSCSVQQVGRPEQSGVMFFNLVFICIVAVMLMVPGDQVLVSGMSLAAPSLSTKQHSDHQQSLALHG